MNIEEAKTVLSAYRPNHADENDPLINEALTLITSTPEGEEWLNKNLERDEIIRSAILRDDIAETHRQNLLKEISDKNNSQKNQNIISYAWPILKIAAVLILGFTSYFITKGIYANYRFQEINDYRNAMAFYAADVYFRLDFLSEKLPEIDQHLVSKKSPILNEIPNRLAEKLPLGCKTLDWQGQKVTLICFHSDEDKIIHLYLIDKSTTSENSFGELGELAKQSRQHGLETIGWTTDNLVCLLVGSEPDVKVAHLLG